jgi:hypothetical protein
MASTGKTHDIQCRKYFGFGHIEKECRTKRVMVVLEDGEYDSASDFDDDTLALIAARDGAKEMEVMGVDGFHVTRTRGTTRQTQRFKRRGLNVGDLGSQRNTVTEASSRRTHNTLQRGTPSFTQVQGPRGD